MRYLLLAYTEEGYLSTRVPGDLFQGTFEVFEKKFKIPYYLTSSLETALWSFIVAGLEKDEFFDGGEITHINTDLLSVELWISWKMCYIEVDDVSEYCKAGIWDEGIDVDFGRFLALKGLKDGY